MTYEGNIPEDNFHPQHYHLNEEHLWNMGDKALESDITELNSSQTTLKLRKQYAK